MQPVDAVELASKRRMQPHGLMNAGKFTADAHADVTRADEAAPAPVRGASAERDDAVFLRVSPLRR